MFRKSKEKDQGKDRRKKQEIQETAHLLMISSLYVENFELEGKSVCDFLTSYAKEMR